MNLNAEEKQANEIKNRIANPTEEKKQKVFYEIYHNKVYLDKKNLLLPNKKQKNIAIIIIAIIFTILLISFGLEIAIKFTILYFIIYFILGVATFITIYPLIKYSCPYCGTKEANAIRKEQKEEQSTTGYIKAYCCNCEMYYNLIVTKDVLEHF